ncbi:MAG: asparagine synthase (glutamine-hydrolyzing) [Candidatus Hydrogenedentes bacterium]|nr:asparagine synthase (glutamine-hydrolyzing) [Candidatus Hydrogenedentota bacterium]
MCGICGIAHSDTTRRIDEAPLSRMNDAMKHRGPDDAGAWLGGHVGLAMRRLSIIDLFRGHQPMANEDGSIVLVFNGEIYNYQELRSDLENQGHSFRTLSDTEVILRAYEQHGDDALHLFNGMFAFALYDWRNQRLLVARDRLGIKPLFYTFHDGVLAFASELDALLQSGLVRGPLDPAALDAYLSFLYVPAPDTIFEDARKLLPGHKLVFQKGELSIEPYWRLRFTPNRSWTLDDAAEAYLDLLGQSVRYRLISDVPLGAFLSGGIDSSSVVGMLSVISAAPVKTFTIGFDDAQADEVEFARIAAKHFGTDHTEEVMKPDLLEMAASLVRHFGEPFADSSAIPTWLVSRLARRHVAVALSGDGGDELFAGYTWTHMTRKVARYRRVPAPLRRLIGTALRLAPESPRAAKFQRFSRDSFLEPHACFRRRQTCFGPQERAALYTRDLADSVLASATDRFQEHADSGGASSWQDRMLYQDLIMYLPDDILTKVDRMSMANSLEARVPILDHRLVEFAATVPFSLKLKGRTSKRLVKHALRSILPPELLRQRKQGFGIPIHRWFREEDGLRGHFEELVLGERARAGRFLKRQSMRALLDAHVSGKENYGHHLWTVLMFEHWLRYIDGIPGVSLS